MEDLSALEKTDIAVEATADSAANILPITNIIHETVDASIVPLPEMVPDAVALEEGTSSPRTSQPALTSKEILAMLKVLWCDKPCVRFSELIPKESYTREDAVIAFDILLELHAQEKLTLQQTECYRTLRIWKND